MNTIKVMVVDDDNNICEYLRLYLEKEEFNESDGADDEPDNFEEEFRDFIDYDEQFKKGLLDPLNNMVKAIKYDIFRQTETLDDW